MHSPPRGPGALITGVGEGQTWAGVLTCTGCWRTWVLCSPHSLGVVLSQGHGEHILLGNTSVEEGGSAASTDGQFRGGKWCSFSRGMLSRASPGQRWWESLQVAGLRAASQSRAAWGGVCVPDTRSVRDRPVSRQTDRASLSIVSFWVAWCVSEPRNFTCQRATQKARERRREDYGSRSVAVCSGCCNKGPQIGGLNNRNLFSHSSGGHAPPSASKAGPVPPILAPAGPRLP